MNNYYNIKTGIWWKADYIIVQMNTSVSGFS